MISSVEFAKFIISRAVFMGIDLGETKLHKLLYICDGYMLAADVNLINERARAWNYGPVYPKVHRWAEKYPDAFKSPQNCEKSTLKIIEDVNAKSLVDRVLLVYGNRTAADLSDWSHSPGSPWETALERGRGIMNSPIDKNDMAEYFKGLLAR